jgi:hypothetical protein
MKDLKWWTLAELDATSETVFPLGLAGILRSLTSTLAGRGEAHSSQRPPA